MYVFLFAWMLFIVNVFYICACPVVCFFRVCTNVYFLIRARMFVFVEMNSLQTSNCSCATVDGK
jgi:hypothetical protein